MEKEKNIRENENVQGQTENCVRKRLYTKYALSFVILLLLLLALFFWNVNAGSVHLTIGEISRILWKQAGMIKIGFAVFIRLFTRWGTAIPTKDTGPAKAVTQEERMLESSIRAMRNLRMLTPIFWAYTSPI